MSSSMSPRYSHGSGMLTEGTRGRSSNQRHHVSSSSGRSRAPSQSRTDSRPQRDEDIRLQRYDVPLSLQSRSGSTARYLTTRTSHGPPPPSMLNTTHSSSQSRIDGRAPRNEDMRVQRYDAPQLSSSRFGSIAQALTTHISHGPPPPSMLSTGRSSHHRRMSTSLRQADLPPASQRNEDMRMQRYTAPHSTSLPRARGTEQQLIPPRASHNRRSSTSHGSHSHAHTPREWWSSSELNDHRVAHRSNIASQFDVYPDTTGVDIMDMQEELDGMADRVRAQHCRSDAERNSMAQELENLKKERARLERCLW